ncbi:MAG: phosphate ABC transporter substrate-binding/OmpA family protein, partial [bacterium]|nr:phosphate ABC transporter substrate-binding/OmpA family protein [bacterium]
MMPLFMERMTDDDGQPKDSRTMPRVFQQVDWSAGGDGIVVRESIKSVKDLRGKKIALAQNSPSHYFVLNMLVAGGVQPREVKFEFTNDAFEAAALYASDKSVAACVSWAPDIYNLADSPGNRMLVDTVSANRLIADVWFARADFAKDHPEICEGLVRGIFDAMDDLQKQENQTSAAELMGEFYNIPASETKEMFADAYSTRWGDNYQFMVNENYLANFERVWDRANYLYRKIRVLKKPKTPFYKIMDNSIIKKLGEEEKYKAQKVQPVKFAPRGLDATGAEDDPVLSTTHYIHFFPNSSDLRRKILRKNEDGEDVEEDYDPNVDLVLKEIADQIGQFELSRIRIEGHTDNSMKGQVDEELVLELSKSRADAVMKALLEKYDQLDPDRFIADGVGWREPADPNRPNDHPKNRRVEVKILPAEG